MSKCAAELCNLIVDELYGELASKVFSTLVTYGRLTLGATISTSQLNANLVRAGLTTLSQHGLVSWYSSPDNGITHYEASLKAAYRLLRYGKYVDLVEEKHGKNVSDLFSSLLLSGYVGVEHISQGLETKTENGIQKEPLNGTIHSRTIHPDRGDDIRPTELYDLATLSESMPSLVYGQIITLCHESFLRPDADNRSEAKQQVEASRAIKGGKPPTKKEILEEIEFLLQDWKYLGENQRKDAETKIMDAFRSSSKKRSRQSEDHNAESPRKRVRFSNADMPPDGQRKMNGERNGLHAKGAYANESSGNKTWSIRAKTSETNDLNDHFHDTDGPPFSNGEEKKTSNIKTPGNANPSLVLNGRNQEENMGAEGPTSHLQIEGKTVVCVSYHRLHVMARNERIVRHAKESLGHATAQVYSTFLNLLEDSVYLPRGGVTSVDREEPGIETKDSKVLTLRELMAEMKYVENLDLTIGMPEDPTAGPSGHSTYAQETQNYRKKDHRSELPNNDSEADSEEDRDLLSSEEDVKRPTGTKQRRQTPSQGQVPSYGNTTDTVRQHLLLLSEHPCPFLVHCPGTNSQPESWHVPYGALVRQLRLHALFSSIHSRYDDLHDEIPGNRTAAVRVARMLHERGKLDDKALANLSLVNPKILRQRLATLHDGGAIGMQELPRDAQRSANRTLYLWFFDEQRCNEKFIEDSYQTMARLLQRLKHERRLKRDFLGKAERSDVIGNEAELLTKNELGQLKAWRDYERRVWSQIGRLDDLISLLRDY